jgi:hypothetical protein
VKGGGLLAGENVENGRGLGPVDEPAYRLRLQDGDESPDHERQGNHENQTEGEGRPTVVNQRPFFRPPALKEIGGMCRIRLMLRHGSLLHSVVAE